MATQQCSAGDKAGVAEAVSILIVEDSADDAEMVLRELRAGGFDPTAERVCDGPAMHDALRTGSYDVVISDYVMPQFSAPRALEIAKEYDPDLPFVAISGVVGEETAVGLMREGADDYVLKDRLARLAPAVRNALERAAERRALREAQEALRRSHEELEQRVHERTAELELANAELSAHREDLTVARDELRVQHEELLVAAAELSGERLRYLDLFESAPVAYVITDPQGAISEANRAAHQLLGYTSVSLNGRRLGGHVSPEATGTFTTLLASAARDRIAVEGELTLRPSGGGRGERIVDCTVAAIRDADGSVARLRWILQDVTEQRHAERALRASEERYRTLFDSIDEGFAVHEMVYDAQDNPIDYRWLHVNPAFARQTGLSDVQGRLAREVLPEIEEHWFATYDRVVQTGQPARLESHTATLDRWYSVYAYRYGRPEERRFAALFSDITERKRAEEALRESRKQLAEELETAQHLQRVSSQFIQADDADALYALILDTAVDIARADFASLQLLDPDSTGRDRLRLLGHRGFSERAARFFEWIYPESRTSCGEVLRGARERVILPDVERSDLLAHGEHLAVYLEEGVHALQTTPLISRSGALLGAFSTYWREPCEPSDRELRAIDVLALQAADLIERRQAEAETQRRLQHLSALYEGSQVLLGEPSAQDVLQRACELAVDRLGQSMAWAGLVPEEPGRPLTPMALAGHEAGWAQRLAFALDDNECRYHVHRAIRARAPVVIDVASDEDMHPEWRAETLARGYRYVAVLPLIRREGVVGVLSVKTGTRDALDAEQMQALQSLANLAAIGVQKARMFETLEQHAERLEAEVRDRTESLRESVALFRAIFDGAASGIGLLDEEGRLFAWNPALERLLVGPDRPFQDCVFRDLLVDDVERQAFGEARRRLFLPGSSPVRIQARYYGVDGKKRWANLLLSVVRDSSDVVRFGLVVVDDITEMRVAQEALLHAEKLSATGRLAASFAHEIKNPLQAVIGCLGLAREATAAGEDADHYFQVAHDELLRANDLVLQLRNLNLRSNLDDRAPTQPAALIERVTALIQKQAQDQGVSVQMEVEDALPDLPVVPDAMQQVLLNLSLNALDAMPHGGTLCFGARSAPGHEVQLTVADTGVGIAPEDLERIFEGFYSTKENGLGLGIFVSQSIVHQHDGRLEVESQVGVGTTFSVFLPA